MPEMMFVLLVGPGRVAAYEINVLPGAVGPSRKQPTIRWKGVSGMLSASLNKPFDGIARSLRPAECRSTSVIALWL